MIVDAEPGPVPPGSAEPGKPGNKEKPWKAIVGCLIVVFVVLAGYDLVSRAGGLSGASAADAASRVVTQQASGAPSAASSSAATPTPGGAFVTPAASPAPHSLAVAAVAAFGPDGTSDGDHASYADRAIEGGRQPWYSSWYLTPTFGNLQAGTGLLLDMGKTVTVSSVRLVLGAEAGADVQVRVGNTAALGDMFTVSSAMDVGGTVRIPTQVAASGRYVLIWFTALPAVGSGRYQVSVYDATVNGT